MPPAGEAMEKEEEKMAEGPAELPPAPAIEAAVAVIKKGTCDACHTIPGVEGAMAVVGPNWCVPAQKVQSGAQPPDYIRASIIEPNANIAEGFPANIMPTDFAQRLTDEEINTVAAFIANLKCE
jgi:cytochrome c553